MKGGHRPPRAICAPFVPSESQFAYQRYFVGSKLNLSDCVRPFKCVDGGVQVYRDGNSNLARLSISIANGAHDSQSGANFTPAALREIAARLLDAAHDIEAHPAHQQVQPFDAVSEGYPA